jgi:hypothetical protein
VILVKPLSNVILVTTISLANFGRDARGVSGGYEVSSLGPRANLILQFLNSSDRMSP